MPALKEFSSGRRNLLISFPSSRDYADHVFIQIRLPKLFQKNDFFSRAAINILSRLLLIGFFLKLSPRNSWVRFSNFF